MKERPLRTTVIGSYPFPGWLEFTSQHLGQFGPDDVAEAQDDAVITAVHDQVAAGLDVITDGEQTPLEFNLPFYGYLDRKSTRLNSSHANISFAVFWLKKKKNKIGR